MSFGAPFGIPFGFAPPTSPAPDDPRALRRRAPVGPDDEAMPVGLAPGQPPVDPRRDGMVQPTAAGRMFSGADVAVGVAPAGLLDAITRASAEQGGGAAAPSPDPTSTGAPAQGVVGLASQMGTQAGQQQPAVAPFSFAGAMPSAPMEVGNSNSFGPGSAGARLPLPSGSDSLGAPASTGSVAAAQRAQAGRPLPFVGAPRATNPAATGFGATPQDGTPLPPPRPTEFGGTGTWAQPETAPPSPQTAAAGPGAPAAADGPSFMDRLGQGITQNASLLTSLGAGLMSTPGWGAGVAAGIKNFQDQEGKRAATGIAQAELGLRLKKSAEDATGLKGNKALAKAAFPHLTEEQLASNNPQLVTAAIARLQNGNAGRDMKADSSGVQRWVDTGQPVFAGDEGKSKWIQAKTPDGGTILYDESNPSNNQLLIPGQPVRPALDHELSAYGIRPGQPVKMTKDGPVAIGAAPTPQVRAFKNADGSETTRVLNQQTGVWEAPNYGANPPEAAATNPFATGKFNEGQGKAAGFTDRMLGSEQVLRELEGTNSGFGGGAAGLLSRATPSILEGPTNVLKSSDRQRFEQAQRDFVNSQLRRESGAAISKSEFDNARMQYFPQPGDGADVIAQKRVNRQRAIEAMGREGGPSYQPRSVFGQDGEIVPHQPRSAAQAPVSRQALEAEARRRGLIQ